MNNNNIPFGSYNVNTGESQEGYIEDGQMKFRPIPWWKKLFTRVPKIEMPVEIVEEYVGTTDIIKYSIFGREDIEVSVYRKYNKYDNKTIEIWFNLKGRKYSFDRNAWDGDKKLVLI